MANKGESDLLSLPALSQISESRLTNMADGEVAQTINTYVFTDLVDSSRLTRALATSDWRHLKDRHDRIVRECALAAGGTVVKALGDGFFIVFSIELPAVRFAVSLQRAMLAEPWRDGVTLQIRVGMDTGPAVPFSDPLDYEGDAVNVASRVCDTARPGEVLLSARAFFGARAGLDREGGEVRLEPVGQVWLKGLPSLEPLYRAWAPGLREGLPPLTRVGNLTSYLAPPPFVGREEILAEAVAELARRPIITLLGPGGMGKTRLATEIGAHLEGSFPAGVWVVPLESVRPNDPLALEILAVLGGDLQAGDADPEASLLRHLTDWDGLLILDNLEQLVEEDGGVLVRLLRAIARRCPSVRIICTSRIDLRLGASVEGRIEVLPLSVPHLPEVLLAPPESRSPDQLASSPSVKLCVERLKLRVRRFSLDETSAPHVAAICRATEGVPLLIELATGHLGRRTLPEIARDVEHALAVPNRDMDRPDRHRDLSRLLDWSVDLLGEEQQFFLRLGVFRSGFTADAAAAITDEPRAEQFLERLTEAHLVITSAAEDYMAEQPRFRLLAVTGIYCRTRLAEQLAHWRDRHTSFYAEIAERMGPDLSGTSPRQAMLVMEQERENMLVAFETAMERFDLETATVLGSPLWELFHRRGLWPMTRESAGRLLAASEASPRIRALSSMALAQAAHDEGQVAESRERYEAALTLWRELADERQEARALHGLGNALRRQDPSAAEQAYRQSLELSERLNDELLVALNWGALGLIASSQGLWQEAEESHAKAVTLFRGWDDPWGLAIALNSRAQNLVRMGELSLARDLYLESLGLKREVGDRRGIAITLAALGRLAPAVGEREMGHTYLLESLAVNRELADAWGCAVTLGAIAELWLSEGESERVLEMATAAREAVQAVGGSASVEAGQLDGLIQAARDCLPKERGDAMMRRGRELSLMAACDAALQIRNVTQSKA